MSMAAPQPTLASLEQKLGQAPRDAGHREPAMAGPGGQPGRIQPGDRQAMPPQPRPAPPKR